MTGLVLALSALLLLAIGVTLFWPRDLRIRPPALPREALSADPAGWLAGRETGFADIIPGTEKRILWQGAAGEKTPLAVIYLHGFTATSEETRPVADDVAAALGANLYFTRFAGHGRGPEAMAGPEPEDWLEDLAEALAVGAAIGDRLLIIATSQGASILSAGLGRPELRAALPEADLISGVVMIAPNFRLASQLRAFVSDLPGAGTLMPLILGPEIRVDIRSEDHGRYWNTRYPTLSVLPMAKLLRVARAADLSGETAPLLLLRSPDDRVVSNSAADKVLKSWAGPMERIDFPAGPGMDPGAHVIAGRIRSPGMTGPVVAAILSWAEGALK